MKSSINRVTRLMLFSNNRFFEKVLGQDQRPYSYSLNGFQAPEKLLDRLQKVPLDYTRDLFEMVVIM